MWILDGIQPASKDEQPAVRNSSSILMDLVGVISSTGSNVVSRSNTNIDNLCAENRHHHYHHHHHQQHEHSTTTNNCQPTTATTTTTITSLSRPGHSDRTASHWPKTTDHLTSPNDKPRFHLSLSGESIHSSVSGWIVAWIGKSCFGKKNLTFWSRQEGGSVVMHCQIP